MTNIFVSSLSIAGPTACLSAGINKHFLMENSVCSLVDTDREVLVLPGGADRLHARWYGTRCSWIGYRWRGGVGVKSGVTIDGVKSGVTNVVIGYFHVCVLPSDQNADGSFRTCLKSKKWKVRYTEFI